MLVGPLERVIPVAQERPSGPSIDAVIEKSFMGLEHKSARRPRPGPPGQCGNGQCGNGQCGNGQCGKGWACGAEEGAESWSARGRMESQSTRSPVVASGPGEMWTLSAGNASAMLGACSMGAVPRPQRGPVVCRRWPAERGCHGSGFDLPSRVQAGSGDRIATEVDRVSMIWEFGVLL